MASFTSIIVLIAVLCVSGAAAQAVPGKTGNPNQAVASVPGTWPGANMASPYGSGVPYPTNFGGGGMFQQRAGAFASGMGMAPMQPMMPGMQMQTPPLASFPPTNYAAPNPMESSGLGGRNPQEQIPGYGFMGAQGLQYYPTPGYSPQNAHSINSPYSYGGYDKFGFPYPHPGVPSSTPYPPMGSETAKAA